jgi:hypothetical protein
MDFNGALSQQSITVVRNRNTVQPGLVSVQVAQAVRNCRKVYINELTVQIADPAPALPPMVVVLDFQHPGLQANDLQVATQFVAAVDWDAPTRRLRDSWHPGFIFAEAIGRDTPVSLIQFYLRDEDGAIIDFEKMVVKFTVEYADVPNSATSSSYAYANKPVAVPAVTKTTWPNWAGTLAPPF